MFLQLLYPYIRFTVGTLYPSYKTWKALKRKDETNRRHWMKYWVSFGAFQMLEMFSDITLAFILPFYTELKLLVILWMVMGTKLLFDTVVNRELARHEKSIDRWLTRIARCRNEILAILWLELSQCSLKLLSALMSGGLSVLVAKSPGVSKAASPDISDGEFDEDTMVVDEIGVTPMPMLKLENNNENENNNDEPIKSEYAVKLEDMLSKSMQLMEPQQKLKEPDQDTQPPTATSTKKAPLVTVRPYRTRLRQANVERASAVE